MEDYGGSDDECYYSDDRESLNGLENEDSDFHWVPSKGPTTRVYIFKGFLVAMDDNCVWLWGFIDCFGVKAAILCQFGLVYLALVGFWLPYDACVMGIAMFRAMVLKLTVLFIYFWGLGRVLKRV